ncbi:potassium/sodium hyperpolarization-activated cyclic nucleotide-gated channel 1-like [Anticarsia gemmatalis]|uniref:potassium/sodium hyperpolarization-activated cyclic nucleotide-gated channel 1-like n=1 Tax=Anticarsia gemmatalis TaxID=129554 RepID=UPI003F76E635
MSANTAKTEQEKSKAAEEPFMNIAMEKNILQGVTSHGYFHGHECHIGEEKLTAFYLEMGMLRKCIFGLTTVHTCDVRALNMYRSYAALCAEKYRHFKNYPFTIHPFSRLRLYMEVIMLLFMLILSLSLAVHYSQLNAGLRDCHVWLICVFDFVTLLNIIANFFTGYIEGHSCKVAVLDLKKIACNYIKTWFISDLISSTSFIPFLFGYTNITLIFILETLKLMRIPISIKYLDNILLVSRVSVFQTTVFKVLFVLFLYISWNIYFQFCVEYVTEGTYYPENPRNCSWLTYGKLWDQPLKIRFLYAFDRAVGMLSSNTNMNLIEGSGCFEIFFVFAWQSSKLIILHFSMKYVVLTFGTESARAMFHIMKTQVDHYLIQRKFPPRLKRKILKFYAIRFQSKYFTESRMLDAVSGQLHDDILMHTGRQLVRELEFLKLLPRSLLMKIVFKLRVVIFIAGDVIFKIHTIGDCLYFIDKGTVAIYSESAKEICHLEDGDFFGEIALVQDHRFRTASAVAVTNCELFRLDKEDFDSTIAYYPTVYENIKKVAINRLERTRVLDEHHKAELRTAEMPSDYDKVSENMK